MERAPDLRLFGPVRSDHRGPWICPRSELDVVRYTPTHGTGNTAIHAGHPVPGTSPARRMDAFRRCSATRLDGDPRVTAELVGRVNFCHEAAFRTPTIRSPRSIPVCPPCRESHLVGDSLGGSAGPGEGEDRKPGPATAHTEGNGRRAQRRLCGTVRLRTSNPALVPAPHRICRIPPL